MQKCFGATYELKPTRAIFWQCAQKEMLILYLKGR